MMAGHTVVLDSNVLIPLSIPASRSTRLFSRLRAAGWPVALSPQILEEVEHKMLTKQPLRRWLKLTDDEIRGFVDDLSELVHMTPGTLSIQGAVPADPQDDIIVAAAVESNASYVVSEDKHLLKIGTYQGIKIMSIAQFQTELDRLGVAS